MIAAALLMLAQATAQASPPATPARFSILADPCARMTDEKGNDVVVCGRSEAGSQRLPLPDEGDPPNHGVPSNPELTGAGALAAEGTPCAATQHGCTVGFGAPIVAALAKGAVGLVKSAFTRHPDKTGRVPIPLDGSDPPTGRVLP